MVLVVAIAEGADPGLLRSTRGRALCPWLTEALGTAAAWDLDCGPAPYEPSNLATAFTGRGRGHHGCYSYWKIRSEGGAPPAVLTSSDVLVPRLWAWPQLAGKRFALVNVQLTFPPEPLDGVVLSYLMAQTLRYTWPRDLVHELKRRGLRYGHDVSVFYRGEPPASYFAAILKVARYQLEAALALGAEHDVLIVNLTIVDRLSHFLWHEADASDADAGAGEVPRLWLGYAFLDEALARLDRLAGDDPMLVFSEIGFGPLDGFERLDTALAAGGFCRMDASGHVAEDGWVAREAVQGSHGILLNDGSHALRQEVADCLRASRNAGGQLLIARADPREALYEGPAVALAPDLVVTPADPRRPPMGDLRWAEHVNRTLQTGWHRDGGFLCVKRARPVAGAASLEAIAPTIAALGGREAPENCVAPVATRL